MSGSSAETFLKNSTVGVYVFSKISEAEENFSMKLGTEKYSGRAMKFGFCSAASWIFSHAAWKTSSVESRVFMWIKLIFMTFPFLQRLINDAKCF